jgi:hypothetical protein
MRVFVSIAIDGKRSDYWFERIRSEFGIAVHVSKIWDGRSNDFASEEYDVLLDGQHGQCECLGFLRWGHCRHVDAGRQLLAEGKLTLLPRPEHVEEKPAKQQQQHYYPECRKWSASPFCPDCPI